MGLHYLEYSLERDEKIWNLFIYNFLVHGRDSPRKHWLYLWALLQHDILKVITLPVEGKRWIFWKNVLSDCSFPLFIVYADASADEYVVIRSWQSIRKHEVNRFINLIYETFSNKCFSPFCEVSEYSIKSNVKQNGQ